MRRVKWIILLVVLSVVPSFAALGQSDSLPFQHTACANGVDLTGKTVAFYNLIDPFNETVYDPVQAGYSDAAEYFNAHGGICGATVVPVYDDALQQGILAAYVHIRSITPKPVLVTLYGSGDGEDLLNYLSHDEIPALNVRAGSSASVYGRDGKTLGWEFQTNPLYVDQIGAMCDYIATNPDRFPKPVIGFVNFDDSWASTSARQGQGYCESLGIGDAGTSTFSGASTSIHAQVQNLLDAGANIIFTVSDDDGPPLVAKTLAEMGLKDKVALVSVNRGMDGYGASAGEATLDANGVPVISGMLGSVPSRSFAEADNPGIQLISAQADQHQRSVTMHNNDYITAWDTTDLFIEVYIQTGNRVGFDHITGADIKQTLENIVYTPLSGVERIDYQGGTRRALAEDRIGELEYLGQDGKTAASATNPPMIVKEGSQQHLVQMLVTLTDYQTAPDLRPGGADVPTSAAATAEAIISPATEPIVTSATASVSAQIGRIVFEGTSGGDPNSEVYVMNADGSDVRQLTDNRYFDGQPVWSPDGSKIVFDSERDGNAGTNSQEIYVMDADGSNPTRLTNNLSTDELPRWSPDGTKIAFAADRDGNSEIYVMNADGSDQTNLSNNPAFDDFPSWSPDGTQIVFSSDRDGHNEIYIMNADGSAVKRVTKTPIGDNLFPAWSPDGTKILFISNRDVDFDVYTINIDGSDVVNLTNDRIDENPATWSPDGSKIIFTSDQNGMWDLYTMNADGSGLMNLTPNSPTSEGLASWKSNSCAIRSC